MKKIRKQHTVAFKELGQDAGHDLLGKDQLFQSDPILNTEDVMKLLQVSRRTLQCWRDNGLISFSAIRGKFYYRMSSINKMLDIHLQTQDDLNAYADRSRHEAFGVNEDSLKKYLR